MTERRPERTHGYKPQIIRLVEALDAQDDATLERRGYERKRPPEIPSPPENVRMPANPFRRASRRPNAPENKPGGTPTESGWTDDDQPQKGIIRRMAWLLVASAASGGVWGMIKWWWWFGVAG